MHQSQSFNDFILCYELVCFSTSNSLIRECTYYSQTFCTVYTNRSDRTFLLSSDVCISGWHCIHHIAINRQYYIPCLKYLTDTYHILTEANDQEHPFARGLAFRRRFCPRALARGQKRRLKASPKAKGCSCSFGTRSGYDMYQSNMKTRDAILFVSHPYHQFSQFKQLKTSLQIARQI